MNILTRRVSFFVLGILISLDAYGQFSNTLEPTNPATAAFVNGAIDNNPRVLAARASYEASLANEKAALKPIYNPQIGFSAENGDTKNRVISLSQSIDWANRREARGSVAGFQSRAAWVSYINIRREIANELIGGISIYQTNMAREELARERVSIMSDFANLSRRRFKQGDLNQVELNTASLAYVEARIAHADIQVVVADALSQVQNIEPDIEPENWPILGPLPPLPALDNKILVARSPEVLLARGEVNTTLAMVELRKREKKANPTISISGGEEGSESLVGIGISIPLFIRNNFKSEVLIATENHNAALRQLDDVLRRSLSQLDNSTLRYTLYYEAWRDWQATGLHDLNNQASQLQILWEAGEISTTDFLLQIRQTLNTRDSALLLQQSVWAAWLNWLMSSGEIETWLEMEITE